MLLCSYVGALYYVGYKQNSNVLLVAIGSQNEKIYINEKKI